jgi:hypothetical protein
MRLKIDQERALLPLNLSAKGGMSAQDRQQIGAGAVKVLPKGAMGRTVLYYHQSSLS